MKEKDSSVKNLILERLDTFDIKPNTGRGRPLDLTRFNLTNEGTFTVRCNKCRNVLNLDKFRSGHYLNGRGFIDTMCCDCRKNYAKNYYIKKKKKACLSLGEDEESILDFE